LLSEISPKKVQTYFFIPFNFFGLYTIIIGKKAKAIFIY